VKLAALFINSGKTRHRLNNSSNEVVAGYLHCGVIDSKLTTPLQQQLLLLSSKPRQLTAKEK